MISYRSRAASEEAARRIRHEIPTAKVVVQDDLTLAVYAYEASLTPAQRALLTGHRVLVPEAPSPSAPLLPPQRARPATKNPSTVAEPVRVAREVFEEFYQRGQLDDRKGAIDAALAKGVTVNTAKMVYRQFRESKGLLGSIQIVRRRAKAKAAKLTVEKQPTAVRVCNGITEPAAGSKAREVWDMADLLHRKLRRVPKRGEVSFRLPDIGYETIKLAFPKWRRFHALAYAGQHHKKR